MSTKTVAEALTWDPVTSPCPITPVELAEMNRKTWDVVKRLDKENERLRSENDKLKLALMLHANSRFQN
jgi:hypothetical protein